MRIPPEDWLDSDTVKVSHVNFSIYGIRDAAKNWTTTYTEFLLGIGFVKGMGGTCNFHHAISRQQAARGTSHC